MAAVVAQEEVTAMVGMGMRKAVMELRRRTRGTFNASTARSMGTMQIGAQKRRNTVARLIMQGRRMLSRH